MHRNTTIGSTLPSASYGVVQSRGAQPLADSRDPAPAMNRKERREAERVHRANERKNAGSGRTVTGPSRQQLIKTFKLPAHAVQGMEPAVESPTAPESPVVPAGWYDLGASAMNWLGNKLPVLSNPLSSLGAEAVELPGTCSVEGGCDPVTPVVAKRSVSGLVADAKAAGRSVEMSKKMKEQLAQDPACSLDGVVVMIADHNHAVLEIAQDYEALVHERFRFDDGSGTRDRMLVENPDNHCGTMTWANRFGDHCLAIGDPGLRERIEREYLASAMRDAAALLRSQGQPSLGHPQKDLAIAMQYVQRYQKEVPRKAQWPDEAIAAEKSFAALEKVVAESNDQMTRRMAADVEGMVDPGQATYVVAGGLHTEGMRAELFRKHPVIYIWDPAMMKDPNVPKRKTHPV